MISYIRDQDGEVEYPLDIMSLRVASNQYDEPVVVMQCGGVDVVLGEYESVSEAANEVIRALVQPQGVYQVAGYSNGGFAKW